MNNVSHKGSISSKPLRVIHVVPHIDQEAAGPSYTVPRICQSHAATGNTVQLTCLAARGPIEGIQLDLHPQWQLFRRFGISTSLSKSLWGKSPTVDVVHNHSIWSMVNVVAGWVVPGRGAKLVTSPHGTLSKWALRRSALKKWFLWPLQRRVLFRADMLHATSEEEYQQIRAKGITAPVAVIPNGIDIPQMPADVGEVRGTSQMRTLLFLSRIHPTKALDRLLKAWSRLEELHPTWKLRIVGKGDAAHVEEVHSLASELGVKRVEFSGPLYGAEKSMAYWQANLFVLPTHSENFGMAVAEALAHGCPAIVGKGAPWEGLELEQCGWWVANDVDTLAATLHEAMGTSSASLVEMGKRGRAWMARDYNWEVIGQDMAAAYRWLITGANRPKCVRLS